MALLVPKLLPTVPVQEQVCPAAFVHRAVAVEPTVRQVTERLSSIGFAIANARTAVMAAKVLVSNILKMMLCGQVEIQFILMKL